MVDACMHCRFLPSQEEPFVLLTQYFEKSTIEVSVFFSDTRSDTTSVLAVAQLPPRAAAR